MGGKTASLFDNMRCRKSSERDKEVDTNEVSGGGEIKSENRFSNKTEF